MNKDEVLKLANECGAYEEINTPLSECTIFERDELIAFANACEKIGMEKLRPNNWTKDMSDSWHQKIPDVCAAFDALIDKAI